MTAGTTHDVPSAADPIPANPIPVPIPIPVPSPFAAAAAPAPVPNADETAVGAAPAEGKLVLGVGLGGRETIEGALTIAEGPRQRGLDELATRLEFGPRFSPGLGFTPGPPCTPTRMEFGPAIDDLGSSFATVTDLAAMPNLVEVTGRSLAGPGAGAGAGAG